ncbi:MAG: ATP-binding protein [Gammaproteobacteria bacterium]|nr:ATP-binding protein [Gammaproteobacteria bacterium]MBU1602079.1 ATP-binding protein [Gammaproteobacteria bacterium]MBU2434126.1 ATP-binding protein [Gammaproteobacteria bacterium]MBU2449120.1 ATP-binding protein [Gammaproteobacteria bacterium]
MTKDQGEMLSDFVQISRHYQRSIRVDADLGRLDALTGYICHATATAILENMARQLTETNQRSFTWTGPFGGGKSSLAVALASALHPDKTQRTNARNALNLGAMPNFDKAFPTRNGWLIVPVVGKRSSVVAELNAALRKAKGKGTDHRKVSPTSLINELCQTAEDQTQDGVLVILDEMGKFLEGSALGHGDDVYFFQELAEAAARANGKLVVVGVLHQSFAQYGARLGTDTRDDWAKVQGRYVDLPFVAASDEVVELIGRAIEAKRRPTLMRDASRAIAESIRSRRPAVGGKFAEALETCWPLHPAMAALLGPISKRQFGQNERSTFGFLASVEPHGFRSYLHTTPIESTSWYRPDNYWDYLRSNLEPAILASPDGHRWSQAVEAIERTEAKAGNPFLVELIKNVAIIDLFRNGSGLAADTAVLGAIFYSHPITEIEKGLEELARLRVILFKKHIGAWSVFEGSDFDIDAAITKTLATSSGVDYNYLAQLMGLHPVVAKRHYHETGTMRWMSISLSQLDEAERLAENYVPAKGEFGLFALALPERGLSPKVAQRRARESSRRSPWPVLVGIPRNHARIEELGAELVALETVKDRHELQGDAVARREVHARLAAVKANLEEQLQAAMTNAQWFDGSNEPVEAGARLSPIASDLAGDLYSSAPLVWSELVNRDSVSSNSVKARRDLLHRMLTHEAVENLGIEGFPAERGLYETLLRSTGLHREVSDGHWRFMAPDKSETRFGDIWQATRDLFVDSSSRVNASDILKLWSAPPFGVKAGIQPVILAAFLLAHQSNVAVYKDGMFIPRLTDADIDEYLQDASRFSLRWVVIDEEKARILGGIANILAEVGHAAEARDPLEAARGLVALVFNLPVWTQRTHQLSDGARAIRDTLLKASDPHKVLFVDLVALLDTSDGDAYVQALRNPIAELAGAYETMLRSVDSGMLAALDAPPDQLDRLRARAEAVAGITGDLRQDSFATRLAKHDGSITSIEGILSLAADKPPRDWTDRDIDAATLEISKVALRFRQAEAFVSVKGRKPNCEAFAVVIGAGTGAKMISRSFDITDRHLQAVESKADELASQLRKQGLSTDVLLAILAKTGMRLAADEEKNHG